MPLSYALSGQNIATASLGKAVVVVSVVGVTVVRIVRVVVAALRRSFRRD